MVEFKEDLAHRHHERLLPDEMKAFVSPQAAREGFGTTSEYLGSLIRDTQRRLAKQALEAKLLEGLEGSSGFG